ncbi:hypothetical protein HDU79_005560 [Rhizoclosmatium sp. JEL0117]|nr:hypothetical protein HDU79_005560 [Rhizoclosmatium sp. JEL0117]
MALRCPLPSLNTLPIEIIQQILIHLPIDSCLGETGFISSRTFARLIFSDLWFAKKHFEWQYQLSQCGTRIWDFLRSNDLELDGWVALPINYKVQLYQRLLLTDKYMGRNIEETREYESWVTRFPLSSTLSYILTKALLQQSYDASSRKNRLFRWCCRRNHIASAKYLLETGIDPSVPQNEGIRIASEYGNSEIVALLMQDARVDPSYESNDALSKAVKNNHIEVVRLLLTDLRVNPSEKRSNAIALAAAFGHWNILSLLFNDSRVNAPRAMAHAFSYAASEGCLDVVEHLIELNGVNLEDPNILMYPCLRGHSAIVAALLATNRVDPSENECNCLWLAATRGHVDTVKILLKDERVDPSLKDNELVQLMCDKGHYEVARLLLKDRRVISYDAGWDYMSDKELKQNVKGLFRYE